MEKGFLLLADGQKIAFESDIKVIHRGLTDKYAQDIVEAHIPDSVIMIDENAFSSCENLRSVVFNENQFEPDLRIIGNRAFDYCTSLREFNFPASLMHIGISAFAHAAFTSADLSNTDVGYMGDAAFVSCDKLMKVKLPRTLKIIPNSCFLDCSELMKISAEGEIMLVENDAFAYCDELAMAEGIAENALILDGNDALIKAMK